MRNKTTFIILLVLLVMLVLPTNSLLASASKIKLVYKDGLNEK